MQDRSISPHDRSSPLTLSTSNSMQNYAHHPSLLRPDSFMDLHHKSTIIIDDLLDSDAEDESDYPHHLEESMTSSSSRRPSARSFASAVLDHDKINAHSSRKKRVGKLTGWIQRVTGRGERDG